MVWTLYLILLALNVLDYATTHVVLSYLKAIGPEWGPYPVWKGTRIGRLVSKPTYRYVEWYEHELNPIARWLLKHAGGIPSLAWFKIVVFIFVTLHVLAMPPIMYPSLVVGFSVLNVVYLLVVINNALVGRRIYSRERPRRVRVAKLSDDEVEALCLPI